MNHSESSMVLKAYFSPVHQLLPGGPWIAGLLFTVLLSEGDCYCGCYIGFLSCEKCANIKDISY